MASFTCFKAYDIRGRMPDELNSDIAYRVGCAYAEFLKPARVVVGHDIRLSSSELTDALARGLLDSGVDVIHIGMCGAEEVYFATFYLKVDGGICVTASHNPKDYNGMKLVREGARPISGDSGLKEIRALAEANEFNKTGKRGSLIRKDTRQDYVQHLLEYVDVQLLKPFKIVVNPGNGGAGLAVDGIESFLPFDLIKVHYEADGNFPHGVPNPLLPENRSATAEAVRAHGADLGLAWDGDFDRCFFFDARGRFLEGYYLVGLLAEVFLLKQPGGKVVHDPRLVWNTQAMVNAHGGSAVQSKAGHAFIKERMRAEDAVYGGEMSAHHYFRDFAYCDSGMIPWLLVTELMSRTGKTLAELVDDCIERFPCSGEINRRIADPLAAMEVVKQRYSGKAETIDYTDGLSMEFGQWRFNLRMSNTEPVVRLNVESRGDVKLMERKTGELLKLLVD